MNIVSYYTFVNEYNCEQIKFGIFLRISYALDRLLHCLHLLYCTDLSINTLHCIA